MVTKAKEEAAATGKVLPKNSDGEVIVKQSDEQLAEIQTLLAENLGEEAAEEMVEATKSINFFRERHEIPPLKIDAE